LSAEESEEEGTKEGGKDGTGDEGAGIALGDVEQSSSTILGTGLVLAAVVEESSAG
jgi:hypothetical protein